MARLSRKKKPPSPLGSTLRHLEIGLRPANCRSRYRIAANIDLKALDAALDRLSGLGGASNALDAWKAKGQNARAS